MAGLGPIVATPHTCDGCTHVVRPGAPRCACGAMTAERVAVTLEAPDGERGVLIGPASRVAEVVRPEAVVDWGWSRCEGCSSWSSPGPCPACTPAPEAVVVDRAARRCVSCGSTAVNLWASWNVVGEWICADCAPDGFVPTEDVDSPCWEAGCTCGWRGASADLEDHPCSLPDPQELLDCCGHARERHYGEYGDGVPRCEHCDCSVKSW